jgi:SAM-dependent methyltransferase
LSERSDLSLPFSFRPDREEEELRAYLGADYLYDLTVFALSGTKLPYLAQLARHAPAGSSVLDYGCGIGSDGLYLLEAGYRVSFADFANPSARYLAWRLERRGFEGPIYDLDRDRVPGDFDVAYAFDVIEHVDEPFAFLRELEARARLVVVNLLEPSADDPGLHRELPIGDLVGHATRRGLVAYRRYWGRSHLVLYAGDDAPRVSPSASRAAHTKGVLAARAEDAREAGRRLRARLLRG